MIRFFSIAAGSGLLARLNPEFGLVAIVTMVLLARFRGRVQAVIGASSFTFLELVSAIITPRTANTDAYLLQMLATICATWLCAIFASQTKADTKARPKSIHPFDVRLDELSEYVWSRTAEGSMEYVSPAFCEYLGISSKEMQDFTCFIHPEDIRIRENAMDRAKATGDPQQFQARYRSATGQYQWFTTLMRTQRDSRNRVIRFFGVHWNIDERMRREEEPDNDDVVRSRELIRDHQTQLNLLGERFPGFLWKALPDGQVTYINSYCEDYLGLSAEKARTGWMHLIHPDDRDEVMRRWGIVVNGGQWHDHVHRLAGKDGQYRWFQSRITAVRDDSGAVVALHGLMMDAHEMVSAERSVQLEEKQLRRLVDAMPAMIWRADPTGRIDRWNRTMVETIGKPWEESETFDLLSQIDPSQAGGVEKHWAKSVRFGIPYEDTYRILGNDGNYHWHIVRAQPFRDEGGNIISWYGIHTDIDALKEAERDLQVRERQLLGIIDTVPSMLWAASPTGEPTHISRRLSEYTGAPLERFLDLGWEMFLHPEDLEETVKTFFRSMQTGEPFSSIHRLRRVNGEYRWHHAMGEPLRDLAGKIIQWYGLSIDIDERKRAEEHLREARVKLNKASKIAMVAELSASIAHELNQPLMSVLGNAQASRRWLAATPPNLDEASASIERIVRDARTADQTMQNIRTLFRRESFERKEASLAEVISEAFRLVQEDRNKQGVPIECFFENDLPTVFVDPIQIQEVFINLISNAIEAMENNPREPKVAIRAVMADHQQVIVQVIDNGPGVDDPEKIFDAFVTTKKTGMGIGLAVSRSIAEAHEGQLWAENNPTFGATFTLTLPATNPEEPVLEP
jgi:PAS domain S-box-containing protein